MKISYQSKGLHILQRNLICLPVVLGLSQAKFFLVIFQLSQNVQKHLILTKTEVLQKWKKISSLNVCLQDGYYHC